MAKSDPHTALQFTEEHVTWENQIKFKFVVTFLETNFCENIIFCLGRISYVSADRARKRDCRTYSWWMANVFALH